MNVCTQQDLPSSPYTAGWPQGPNSESGGVSVLRNPLAGWFLSVSPVDKILLSQRPELGLGARENCSEDDIHEEGGEGAPSR